MTKAKRMIFLAMLVCAWLSLADYAQAQRINGRDGYIEYVKFTPDAVEIKLTTAGLNYGTAYYPARNIAYSVETMRPRAYRHWPPINLRKLAVQIQAHANAWVLKVKRKHANPVNVYWREIT